MSRRAIRIPGSIGNLGPGFDTLGLAVAIYLRVTIRRTIDDGRGQLLAHYERPRPAGEDGIVRAFQLRPFTAARPRSIEVDVASDIPERAGLGSSAAATLAGLTLRALSEPASAADILRDAVRLEGHPDNAAASMFGGLTSSSVGEGGGVSVTRWRWPAAWKLVVATPDVQLSTDKSRGAIPAAIPLPDVVFNLQRVAMLLGAVQKRNASQMAAALADRVHQPYREPLVPVLRRALALRHPDVLGVCLSGAGPSVVAIARRNAEAVARALTRAYRAEDVPCTVRVLNAHQPATNRT
jgi:homoserine kinase